MLLEKYHAARYVEGAIFPQKQGHWNIQIYVLVFTDARQSAYMFSATCMEQGG